MIGARSSVVERVTDNYEVLGSIPSVPTNKVIYKIY